MGLHVPPGYSPPFQVVDKTHHGAWVVITAALGLVISLVSVLIRMYVRAFLNPPFAVDDCVLLGATVVAIIQSSLVFGSVTNGFGTSMNLLQQPAIDHTQVLITVSHLLFLITIYVSKCCVIGIHLRLTPQKWHNRIAWATLALCTVWVVISVCIIAINCGFNRPWTGEGTQCNNLIRRWVFIVSMDIITELILFALAVVLLARLYMPLKRKFTVGFAFFFRLPLILFSIFIVYSLDQHFNETNPTLSGVAPIIWSQVELNYTLIACSVFILRPFMAAVSTNYGTAGDSHLESGAYASRTPKNGSSSKTGGSGSGTDSAARTTTNTNATGTGTVVSLSREEGEKRGVMGWNRLLGEKGVMKMPGHAHTRLRSEDTGALQSRSGGAGAGAGVGVRTGDDGVAEDAIELVARGGQGSACDGGKRMFIRKDVQYSVEYKRKRSEGEFPTCSETEYWDQYLDHQRP